MPARTRLAFIGAGGVARRHAAVLDGFADVTVAGAADPDVSRAEELAARFGARVYADYREMLVCESLDAVYICVPPFAHGAPERAVLSAGLPFFVEKPLAADYATAAALAKEVRAASVPTAAGYHWRYLDTVEQAGDLLATNPARLAVGYWLDKVPPPAWWVDRRRSGGQTIEQATHVLDLTRALIGEVEEVSAIGARCPRAAFPNATIDDVSAATLLFRTGAVGSLVSTCLLDAKHRAGLEVFADGLALLLTEDELVVARDGSVGTATPLIDAKRAVDRAFIDAVRGKPGGVRVDYHEALATHRLACALARSAEDATPVAASDGDLYG